MFSRHFNRMDHTIVVEVSDGITSSCGSTILPAWAAVQAWPRRHALTLVFSLKKERFNRLQQVYTLTWVKCNGVYNFVS